MVLKNQNPSDQIKANNPWYTDEQFSRQYKRPGPRAVIENRWTIFQKAIEPHIKSNNFLNIPPRMLDVEMGSIYLD